MIETRLQASNLKVSADQFPGTINAQIRIYASDGLRSSQATSESFTMEKKGPVVHFTLPLDGSSLPPDIPVMLTGSAFDREDGMLAGDTFTWRSNLDGELGTGDQIFVSLSEGWHTLTLSVRDSDGKTASTSIDVYSGYKLQLPLVSR